MKYKPGDKFIVEVEDNSDNTYSGYTWYTLKGGFHTCDAVLDSYEPYDESADYQRGLDDAWEAARKVFGMTIQELYDAFGEDGLCLLQKTTVAEALARIRDYEETQKIHVGDEVTCKGYGGKAVVTHVNDKDATILHWLGGASCVKKDHLTKTGRNFPEVAALLDKMKGDAGESN